MGGRFVRVGRMQFDSGGDRTERLAVHRRARGAGGMGGGMVGDMAGDDGDMGGDGAGTGGGGAAGGRLVAAYGLVLTQ